MAEPGTPVVEGRGLWKHYGALTALRDVDLTLHAGEVVGLVGERRCDDRIGRAARPGARALPGQLTAS